MSGVCPANRAQGREQPLASHRLRIAGSPWWSAEHKSTIEQRRVAALRRIPDATLPNVHTATKPIRGAVRKNVNGRSPKKSNTQMARNLGDGYQTDARAGRDDGCRNR